MFVLAIIFDIPEDDKLGHMFQVVYIAFMSPLMLLALPIAVLAGIFTSPFWLGLLVRRTWLWAKGR